MSDETSSLDDFFPRVPPSPELRAETRRLGIVVGGSLSKGLSVKLDRSAVDLRWTPDGKKILFALHDGVRHHLHAVDLAGGRIHPLTEGDRVVSELSAAAQRMAFISASPMRRYGRCVTLPLLRPSSGNPTG